MIPEKLKTWFVVHFIVDLIAGFALFLAPGASLRLLGWETIDPFTARLAGAAFLGIGWESLLGRHAEIEQYRGMLRLKLIWGISAMVGILIGLFSGQIPVAGWLFLAIFGVFVYTWAYYANKLRKS